MMIDITRSAAALLVGCTLLVAGIPARAALHAVGTCGNASTEACIVTDGTFEYLSMGGARVKSGDLPALFGQGWQLGTRADFVGMIERNAPLYANDWNDILLGDGSLSIGVTGAQLASAMPDLRQARTGSESIAAAFKDIILQLGGANANPAYLLIVGTGELADNDTTRRTMTVAAYYTDLGTSISRNNVFHGVQGNTTRSLATESIAASNYFLLRPVSAVPEPQSYALFGIGLAMLGAMARIRRRPTGQ